MLVYGKLNLPRVSYPKYIDILIYEESASGADDALKRVFSDAFRPRTLRSLQSTAKNHTISDEKTRFPTL